MAVGMGHMLGFHFPENFNYPYISKSITEFWRRWHISLGTWFKEYVYIPLGGNRKGGLLQVRNILVVWLLTGIWHGASVNFLLWGIYFGLLLLLEKFVLMKYLKKLPSLLQCTYAFLLVLLGWVLFAFEDMGQGFQYLLQMTGAAGSPSVMSGPSSCFPEIWSFWPPAPWAPPPCRPWLPGDGKTVSRNLCSWAWYCSSPWLTW